jgi:hypothetical protein
MSVAPIRKLNLPQSGNGNITYFNCHVSSEGNTENVLQILFTIFIKLVILTITKFLILLLWKMFTPLLFPWFFSVRNLFCLPFQGWPLLALLKSKQSWGDYWIIFVRHKIIFIILSTITDFGPQTVWSNNRLQRFPLTKHLKLT